MLRVNTRQRVSTISRDADAINNVTLKLYDSFEELAPIQQKWDELVESAGGGIFLTFDWCRIWWKYYGKNRDLDIFTFWHKKELVGIVPIFFETIWLGPVYIRTAKILSTDFTLSTVILPIQKGFSREVMKRFLDEIIMNYQWDVLLLGPLSGIYDGCVELLNSCREYTEYGYKVVKKNLYVQTYFPLPETWEKYVANLRSNERGNIRRNYNALLRISKRKSESLTSCFAKADNFEEFFEEFVQLHQSRWQRVGKLGHFGDWPSSYEFHHEQAESQLRLGRLRLLKVSLGEQCLGYQYHYKFGNYFVHFLDAFSDDDSLRNISLGRVTFCEQIKKVLEERVGWIDSLRNKYEHKLRLGGKLFPVNSVYIYSDKLWSTMRMQMFSKLAWLIHILYYKIWFCRIAPKLPIERHALRRIWIRSKEFV